MPGQPGRLAGALLLALTLGCASAGPRTQAQNDLITEQQIRQHSFHNAYEAVKTLHPTWLLARGAESFRLPNKVIVYLDYNRLGGVETLSGIGIDQVRYIQHYDANEATARWGTDHSQGAIVVSTHPL